MLNEALRTAHTLDRLQADIARVVSSLEDLRIERSLRSLRYDRDLSDELRISIAVIDELGSQLQADTEALSAAIDVAFSGGLSNLPHVGNQGDRYSELANQLIRELAGADELLEEFEALRELDVSLRQHLERLSTERNTAERVAALQREVNRLEADVAGRMSELTSAMDALAGTIATVSDTTCAAYGYFESDALLGCQASERAADYAELSAKDPDALALELFLGRVTVTGSRMRVRHSVYEFFDDEAREPQDYGLYTYVLFIEAPRNRARNTAFLQALFDSTVAARDVDEVERRQLNLFSIPVRDLSEMPPMLEDAGRLLEDDIYDDSAARSFLFRLCEGPDAEQLGVCTGGAWTGPYLLTHPRPQSQQDVIEVPYLFVDLSDVREQAYGEFIRAVKEQVARPDFDDRERLDTFRLALLNITLIAADWVRPIRDGIRSIIFPSG